MSLPSWYDPNQVGKVYAPNCDRALQDGAAYARQNNISAWHKGSSEPNVVLTVIDCQVDFISPPFLDGDTPTFQDTGVRNPLAGNLAVPGAIEDTDRTCQFIYNNVGTISHIVASLDSHFAFQPFHRFNWRAGSNPANRADGSQYSTGDFPDPFTIITLDDVNNDVWAPTRNPAKMREMLQQLEQHHQKNLCIWPLHCEIGTPGHSLMPAFMEAVHYHSGARSNQYNPTTKGMSLLSEHYGILKAEVEFPEDKRTHLNTQMLDTWHDADRIYFAGQAKSHCCLETLNQVVKEFTSSTSTSLLDKLYVLVDCMSSVPDIVAPDGTVIAPFNQWADDRFAELEKMGVKFVTSTDPIDL